MTNYILDENHEANPEPDIIAWAKWFDQADRRVEMSEIPSAPFGEPVRVSTMFLGIDHAFGGGPPLLFETMIFGGSRDQEQHRYSTWDEAVAGHRAIVESFYDGDP